jgi:hypothetical protein
MPAEEVDAVNWKGNGRRRLDETSVVVSSREMRAKLVGASVGTLAGAFAGAATPDRQHGMAAPLSGRQPELIPISHLPTSDGCRQESRSSSPSSISCDLRIKNQPDYTGLDSPGLHAVAEFSSMRSRPPAAARHMAEWGSSARLPVGPIPLLRAA